MEKTTIKKEIQFCLNCPEIDLIPLQKKDLNGNRLDKKILWCWQCGAEFPCGNDGKLIATK